MTTLTAPAEPRASAKPSDRKGFSLKDAISRLDPTRHSQVTKIASSTPISHLPGYFRALEGKASPRRAIKTMCLQCCGWERKEAALCTARGCPLWAYRPKAESTTETT